MREPQAREAAARCGLDLRRGSVEFGALQAELPLQRAAAIGPQPSARAGAVWVCVALERHHRCDRPT